MGKGPSHGNNLVSFEKLEEKCFNCRCPRITRPQVTPTHAFGSKYTSKHLKHLFSAGQTVEHMATSAFSTAPKCDAPDRLLGWRREQGNARDPSKSKVFKIVFFKLRNPKWGCFFSDKTKALEIPSGCFQGCECPKWLDYQVIFKFSSTKYGKMSSLPVWVWRADLPQSLSASVRPEEMSWVL